MTDADLARRRRELTTARNIALDSRDHIAEVGRRAFVCLAYAHWEGFVRNSANAFLRYVDAQGLRAREAAPQTIALHFRTRLREAERANSPIFHTSLIQALLDGDELLAFPVESTLDVGGNLTSKVLGEVLCILGADTSWYDMKATWIDRRLVETRNRIAHGELLGVPEDDLEDVSSTVMALLDRFRTDVQNAAAMKAFRR